jgi:protein-S-isoprenylcysteine O-methyltransferase Ste14
MFEKTLMTLAAAAAIAAAAAVFVVSLAFAFYQVMIQWVGPAGAAAAVAGVAGLCVLIAGLIAASRAGAGRRRAAQAAPVDHSLVNTIIGIVRDRPLLSAGAAVAAGIFALRNPAFLSAVVQGFMESQRKRD